MARASSHDSSPTDKRPPQAALEAAAPWFGYHVTEAVGAQPLFLECEGCGRSPAVVQVFTGARPRAVLLSVRAWCGECTRDTHHVVTITPRPWSAP